ncbi:MAG: nucleoside deaminase [Candidatus Omnitrophica bacterium]|nr:nucleoside deaminase [Candidatus Omnitrophota bacterium]
MSEKYMQAAIDEAYRGIRKGEGGPFGAVIVKDGKIIGKCHNTVLKGNDPTKHAEMNAISAVSRKLKNYVLSGCTIYSTTEPCPMCFSAIHWARIDKLVFGTKIQDVRKLGFNELAISAKRMKTLGRSPLVVESGFMRGECIALLKEWKKLEGKTY